MGRSILGLAIVAALLAGASQAAPRIVAREPSAVAGDQRFVLHSPTAGRDFLVQVSAPEVRPRPGRRAAAIYVLDGDSRFRAVTAAARAMARDGRMAPAYVIAIGYPPGVSAETERLFDLVHPKAVWRGAEIGGRGAAFEAFVVEELRPFVEGRYRVSRRRSILMGHSIGGLFAATVMSHAPRAFGGYFIASPSLQFDPGLIARLQAVDGGGRRVFIAVGGEEGPMVPVAEQLAAAISRPGSGFSTRRQTFAGQTHMSLLGPMLAPGLGYLLPPPAR